MIHTNYRALVDMTSNGGFGRLDGPNIDLDGNDVLGEGMIPGTEYLAFARTSRGPQCHPAGTVARQLRSRPSPVSSQPPSSGSRGVYGAIATTGEWASSGLRGGLPDKGTGAGGHDSTPIP